ncbi:hypothetical protein GCM10011349_20430 [Novosphingobium indicum]|uniref:Uncharacterized protein n=1 Tax=Novosphingobium indicum TaxID=462949 RepID=A0ABQ2JK91_9SPHN|nr:hypothetical protein [Novosphingobium indicum]GGN49617.1 hypothetical protein GCM10011349_20430 [Novosphingobium indicum]
MSSAARKPRSRHYATKAKVKSYVETARELGIKIGGVELAPDGTIRILAEQAVRAANTGSAYDDWKREGN